jgi:3-oxoacyl-[acyl-carrier-protein] synthase III
VASERIWGAAPFGADRHGQRAAGTQGQQSELADKVDTSDEWIVERTGIRSRYIAGEGRPPPRWPPMPRAPLAAPAWRARAST